MELRAENITAGYGKISVLEGLSVELPAGSFTAIVGPNGCGKSTLLKVLACLMRPWRGRVRLDGRDLASLPIRTAARALAVLPQQPTAPPEMTVGELVACGRLPHVRRLGAFTDEDRRVTAEALADCGLGPLIDRRLSTLSGGQRQRAWLAMALAQQTRVLLLDEPLASLDINHQLEVMDLLARLNRERGLTVGVVVHDLNLAARFCPRLMLMHRGRVVRVGSPSGVFDSGAIEEVFQVRLRTDRDPLTGRPVCHFYRQDAPARRAVSTAL